MSKYVNILQKWIDRISQHKDERMGQALMNTLREHDITTFDIITVENPDADCFYKDELLDTTLEFIYNRYRKTSTTH